MHPELFTLPGTSIVIPTYGFCMAVGFSLAIWLGIRRAKRVGANPEVMVSIGAIAGVAGVMGARGMHLVHHHWQRLTGGQMDAGDVVATLTGGGEILGGVLLAALCIVIYLVWTRQPIRRYLDITMPSLILAMAIGRIGCFMYGCCWGQVCTTPEGDKSWPWAVRFPYGTPAYVMQWSRDQISVPNDLLMISPIDGKPEPFPANLLADPLLVESEALHRFAVQYRAMANLPKADRSGPAGTELRNQMRGLRGQLPGGNEQRQSDYVACALHLNRLSQARSQEVGPVLDSLRQIAATQQSAWVHPTQLYDLVSMLLIFVVLSVIFYRGYAPGMVVAWMMVLYPVSRFCIELLRADNPRDVGGLTLSQAISVVVLLGGFVFMFLLKKTPRQDEPVAGESTEPCQ